VCSPPLMCHVYVKDGLQLRQGTTYFHVTCTKLFTFIGYNFNHRTNAACIVALTNKEKIDHAHWIIRTVILYIVSQFDNGILFKFASILITCSLLFSFNPCGYILWLFSSLESYL
jgi:hypothetical protein